MHSIHYYSMGQTHSKNISSVYAAERAIQVCSSLIDLARCEFDLSCFPDVELISTKPKSKKRPTICLDEWNVWDPERAPGDKGAEEKYTLSDGLAVAVWLNILVRNSKELGMATIAQSVNVIAPLMTTPNGVWRQTTYFPLYLFSKYMQGKAVSVQVRSRVYTGETFPQWVASTVPVPTLDVSAVLSEDGWMNLAVVNTDEQTTQNVDLSGIKVKEGEKVKVYTVGGSQYGVMDTNSENNEQIGIQESEWDTKTTTYAFEKLSFTLLRWKL